MTRSVSELLAASLLAILLAAGSAAAAPGGEQVAPVNTVSPTISGKPRVGQTLSASQGEWQGSPTSFFYQWLRCDSSGASCAEINGAADPTYDLTGADAGSRIRVEVIAQNADGASPASRSAATSVIKIPVPVSTSRPKISGVPREGQTLSASTGQWSGAPTSFEYAWKRCLDGHCPAITGATASTYTLTAADVGTRVRVRVVAINDGGRTSAQSLSTGTVRSASSGFELGPARHDRKHGFVRFRVTVPSAGVLTLSRTAKVRRDRREAAAARTLKLTVKPRGHARAKLRRRGKVRVRIRVGFVPASGIAIQRQRRVVLRQK